MTPDSSCDVQNKRACNINARGKAARLVGGAIVSLIGGALIFAILMHALVSPAWWVLAIVSLASGLFMIYEGWAGWCALRALGWRTPI